MERRNPGTKTFFMAHYKKPTVTQEVEEHRAAFSLAFFAIFIILFAGLWLLDLMPNAPGTAPSSEGLPPLPSKGEGGGEGGVSRGETPTHISIDAISLSVNISNPATTSIEVLDNALLSGAVRYPTSAPLGVRGTVLLFGHSSYLPIVHNQAYKAFDGIQNLLRGDTIVVSSATKSYKYQVVTVKKVNVNDAEANTIPLPVDAEHLVLVTCNSFASKADRFVVTADLSR